MRTPKGNLSNKEKCKNDNFKDGVSGSITLLPIQLYHTRDTSSNQTFFVIFT